MHNKCPQRFDYDAHDSKTSRCEAKHGLSRDTIYLRIAQGTFPKPVKLAGRAVGWLEAEVQQWLQRRIEASRNESHGVGATLGARRSLQTENLKTGRIFTATMWLLDDP
jgi:prophage regulatory protein